jgi:hypothetical protein
VETNANRALGHEAWVQDEETIAFRALEAETNAIRALGHEAGAQDGEAIVFRALEHEAWVQDEETAEVLVPEEKAIEVHRREAEATEVRALEVAMRCLTRQVPTEQARCHRAGQAASACSASSDAAVGPRRYVLDT